MEKDLRIPPSDIAMIADDLAGACDTGFEFLGTIGRVTVVVDSDSFGKGDRSPEGLAVYNTESRDLPADEAYEKTRRAAQTAGAGGQRVLMKKTDSAFRGQFGREIAAVMDALDIRLCCLAPAIPDFGRVTRNGIQYIDGIPIAKTFYNKDPKHPVAFSEVAKHAAIGNERSIGLMDLKTLQRDRDGTELARLIASGVKVVVVDGQTQRDLETAAKLFLKRSERILFVGGQGIGNSVAASCVPSPKGADWVEVQDGPLLIVCGTLHPRSRAQLHLLSQTHRIDPIVLQMGDSLSIGPAADSAASLLMEQMKRSAMGVLTTPEGTAYDPALVESMISMTVRRVCNRISLSGLLLTGGSTGYEACRRLGIKRLHLRERISPGTVIAQAPDLSNTALLIKGGSLGEPDAFIKFVETVQSLIPRA